MYNKILFFEISYFFLQFYIITSMLSISTLLSFVWMYVDPVEFRSATAPSFFN